MKKTVQIDQLKVGCPPMLKFLSSSEAKHVSKSKEPVCLNTLTFRIPINLIHELQSRNAYTLLLQVSYYLISCMQNVCAHERVH